MSISVILSTYNSTSSLERVICGYSVQKYRDFELVVADDGSTEETRRCLERLRDETGLRILHVWQEDNGFRKCRILNKATEAASAEYLVYSDGDCIPRRDFLAVHARLARPGCFLSGGRFSLSGPVSATIGPADVLEGRVFDPMWLRRRGTRPTRKFLKVWAKEPWARRLDLLTPTRATWNGHNSSAWKRDILAVNGFDERMSYGGEDRELGERLCKAGIRGIQVRHRAICVHLHHPQVRVGAEVRRANLEIRRQARGVPEWLSRFERWGKGRVWTEHGIWKGPAPDATSRAASATGTG